MHRPTHTSDTGIGDGSAGAPRAMISADDALRLTLEVARPRAPERVPILRARGRVLAEPAVADRDHPPFRRAMMDGFAVRVASAGKTVRVAGLRKAGDTASARVTDEACVEIMTGAPCPPGTEAVVQKEHVRRSGDHVALPARIEVGRHIAAEGSECRRGATVLHPGDTVTALGIAALAAFGIESVLAVPFPTVAVVTTGAELAAPGRPLSPAAIRNSNGPMLAALVEATGAALPVIRHAPDDHDAMLDALREVADRDVLVLSGGVSAGTFDLVPGVLDAFGAETVFHRVRQKPGKPLLFARRREQLIFGLPGNPLASHLTFSRYVAAAIRAMAGEPPRTSIRGTLAAAVRSKGGRTHFVPARVEWTEGAPGGWRLHPLGGVSSADVFRSAEANAYVEVPPGNGEVPAGSSLCFHWIEDAGRGISDARGTSTGVQM